MCSSLASGSCVAAASPNNVSSRFEVGGKRGKPSPSRILIGDVSTVGAGAVALSRLWLLGRGQQGAQVVVHVNNANNTIHQWFRIDLCPAIQSRDWHPVLIVPDARRVGDGNCPVVDSTRLPHISCIDLADDPQ